MPKRPRSHDRKPELLDAALRAIKDHGAGVSMEQMAAEAGVTKPILYRHVGGRSELVASLAIRFADMLMARLGAALEQDAAPRDLLVAAIDSYLTLIEEEQQLYQFLTGRVLAEQSGAHEALTAFIDEIARRIAVVVGEQLRDAELDSGPAEAWAFGLVGMVQAAGDWWIGRRTLPRERLVDYLVALVWNGLDDLGLRDSLPETTNLTVIEDAP